MVTRVESKRLRFDMFTGEERFIAPNAVLVCARTDAVLIDVGGASATVYGFGMSSYFRVEWL